MSALLKLNGREVTKVFEKFEWRVVRQRGSHIIMVKDGQIATLSIPDHDEFGEGNIKRSYPFSGTHYG